MGITLSSFKTSNESSLVALTSLNEYLKEFKDGPILLLFSGGSAFSLLEEVKETFLGSHITISVLDERYSKDPKVNNFLQLMSLPFYKKAKKKGCNFIPTDFSEDKSLEDAAGYFNHQLRSWREKFPEGKIIITQGMGEDGHTSGIMPFPEDQKLFQRLFEGERWVAGYNAEGKNPFPLRVTTTITFLKECVDHSIVFIKRCPNLY